jgi:hypothetical protein
MQVELLDSAMLMMLIFKLNGPQQSSWPCLDRAEQGKGLCNLGDYYNDWHGSSKKDLNVMWLLSLAPESTFVLR